MLTVTVPLPHQHLSPNARPHFRAKAKATRESRARANEEAQVEMLSHYGNIHDGPIRAGHPWGKVTVQATYFRTSKRRMDGDNALASLKSTFDGIADSGLISDDREITHLPVQFLVDKDNPRVELRIERSET
jgi:crossover junction endodeoxyribonuclease RusA